MWRFAQWAALCAAVGSVSASSFASQLYLDPIYGYSKTSDIQFGTGATTGGGMPLLLDVYQPTDIGQGRVRPNRPAVILQDGGAWTSGEKDNGRVVTPAVYLAQRGYTVFIADYRQVGDGAVSGPGPWQNLSFSGNGSGMGGLVKIYPGANIIRSGIEDFASAISFVRSNAASFGINPNLIAAGGGSAGAVNVMDLQYNNNPVDPAYRAQAVISLVGTMYGDWDKVQAGGPPLYLWNNALDPVIWYGPDVEPNLHNRLQEKGIYYEQWMEDPTITDHNVHYDQYPTADPNCPWLVDKIGDTSRDALGRVADFLAYHFAGGPVEVPLPPVISVTSIENKTVWDIDRNGAATALAGAGQGLFGPVGAAHDAAGNLFVSDFLLGKVWKIDPFQNVSTFATGAGTATPAGLDFNAAGNLVVDNYLTSQLHTLNGGGGATLVADGSDVNQPLDTAVDPATGAIYVAEPGTSQVIKLDSAGNATVFADLTDGLLAPVSLAVSASGDVYVGDGLTSRIFKFTPAGAGSVFADASDGVVTPTGLDFDAAGNLFVANYLGNNVLKFTPAGVGSVFTSLNRPFGLSAVPGASVASLSGAASVPEPSTWCLALAGAALLAFRRRSRGRPANPDTLRDG